MSRARAQVRPEPRGNLVLGNKLPWGRARPSKNQVTPPLLSETQSLRKETNAQFSLQGLKHIGSPQAAGSLCKDLITESVLISFFSQLPLPKGHGSVGKKKMQKQ